MVIFTHRLYNTLQGQSDLHRRLTTEIAQIFEDRFAADPHIYISTGLMVSYVNKDRHRFIVPDVMVVRGVEKYDRDEFLIWREGKSPDFVLEVTSSSTSNEDRNYKFELYEQKLKVKELFLFDPRAEYLDPPFQGYRIRRGKYAAIPRVKGRIPSSVLGLHLEASGRDLRLYDPTIQLILSTRAEALVAANRALKQAEKQAKQADAAKRAAEVELLRARAEADVLRRRLNG